MSPPLVSVIIPVNDQVEYLSRAIDSVLDQSIKDVEVIVPYSFVAGHYLREAGYRLLLAKTLPSLRKVVARYSDCKRVRFIKGKGGNIASLFNLGASHAGGEFLCWLDPQDSFLPFKLSCQLKQYEEQPDLEISYSDAYVTIDGLIFDLWDSSGGENRHLALAIARRNFIHRSTLMMRKSTFIRVGLLEARFRWAPEVRWLFKAADKSYFGRLGFPTARLEVSSGLRYLSRGVTADERRVVKEYAARHLPTLKEVQKICDLGFALVERGLFQESGQAFEQALRVSPANPRALLGQGFSLVSVNQLGKGCRLIREAMEGDPKSPESRNHLATALWRLGDWKGLSGLYEETEKLLQQAPTGLTILAGLAKLRSGDEARANELIERAAHMEPGDAQVAWAAAEDLFKAGRYDLALSMYEMVNEVLPTLPVAFYKRGICLYHLGRYRAAVSMATQAINKGRQDSRAYRLLARSLCRAGWAPSAIEAWRMALERNPFNIEALAQLVRYRFIGEGPSRSGVGLPGPIALSRALGRLLKGLVLSAALSWWLCPSPTPVTKYSPDQLKFYFTKYSSR